MHAHARQQKERRACRGAHNARVRDCSDQSTMRQLDTSGSGLEPDIRRNLRHVTENDNYRVSTLGKKHPWGWKLFSRCGGMDAHQMVPVGAYICWMRIKGNDVCTKGNDVAHVEATPKLITHSPLK